MWSAVVGQGVRVRTLRRAGSMSLLDHSSVPDRSLTTLPSPSGQSDSRHRSARHRLRECLRERLRQRAIGAALRAIGAALRFRVAAASRRSASATASGTSSRLAGRREANRGARCGAIRPADAQAGIQVAGSTNCCRSCGEDNQQPTAVLLSAIDADSSPSSSSVSAVYSSPLIIAAR